MCWQNNKEDSKLRTQIPFLKDKVQN